MSRYSRQVRLPEIGAEGQARLEAARVALGAEGFAGVVERTYLAAAGVKTFEEKVAPRNEMVASRNESLGVVHPAAREVAEGSLRALASIAAVLDARRGSPP